MINLQQLHKPGLVLALLLIARLSHGQNVDVDTGNQNTGSLSSAPGGYGLHLGAISSGEGIASKRSSGGNQWGLDFYTGFTNRMSISIAGNVGVGTTAPVAKLDVAGDANITGTLKVNTGDVDKIFLTSAGAMGSKIGHASGWGVLNYAGPGSGNSPGFHSWLTTANATYAEQMRLTPTGLGIGTTVPTAKLEVAGDTRLAGTLTVTGSTQISGILSVTGAGGTFGTFVVDPLGANTGSLNTGSSGGNCLAFGGGLGPLGAGAGIASKGNAGGNQNGLDFYTVSTNRMSITNTGNVGIGTTAPGARLDVAGDANITGTLKVNTGDMDKIFLTSQGAAGSKIGHASGWGVLNYAGPGSGNSPGFHSWYTTANSAYAEQMRLTPTGLGIGTSTPTAKLDVAGDTRLNGNVLIGADITKLVANYSLSMTAKKDLYGLWVEKGVVAKDFAIATSSSWSDFVFAPGYRLAPLSETERYIRQHGHLPEMPSAADVKKDGYSVHEMNTRLLQKIEELTLHSIEQEKQLQANGQELSENRQQLSALQGQLRQYEALAAEVAHLKVLMEK